MQARAQLSIVFGVMPQYAAHSVSFGEKTSIPPISTNGKFGFAGPASTTSFAPVFFANLPAAIIARSGISICTRQPSGYVVNASSTESSESAVFAPGYTRIRLSPSHTATAAMPVGRSRSSRMKRVSMPSFL